MAEDKDYYKPRCPTCGKIIGVFDNDKEAPTTQDQLDTLIKAHMPNCSDDDMAKKS